MSFCGFGIGLGGWFPDPWRAGRLGGLIRHGNCFGLWRARGAGLGGSGGLFDLRDQSRRRFKARLLGGCGLGRGLFGGRTLGAGLFETELFGARLLRTGLL